MVSIKHKLLFRKEAGFALLLTLVIVSVVLALGLSLLDITLKQVALSGTARDSEVAFHAAYAAAECAEYYQRNNESQILNDTYPNIGWCLLANPPLTTNRTNTGNATIHEISFRSENSSSDGWGPNAALCSEAAIFVIDAHTGDQPINFSDYSEDFEAKTCGYGTVCTAIFARGYNRPCNELTTSVRVTEREVVVTY